MYETVPIMRLPLPDGGYLVVLVEAIGGATSHKNPQWCDVYIDGFAETGITIACPIDTFMETWFTVLVTPLADFHEIEVELEGAVH